MTIIDKVEDFFIIQVGDSLVASELDGKNFEIGDSLSPDFFCKQTMYPISEQFITGNNKIDYNIIYNFRRFTISAFIKELNGMRRMQEVRELLSKLDL